METLFALPPLRGIQRWPVISLTKVSFDVFFYLRWVNSRDAGDLRRHRAHFDVIVIITRIGVDRFLWRHLASLGYDELKLVNGFQI